MKTTRIYRPRYPMLKLVLAIAGGVSLLALLIIYWISSGISDPLFHQQGAARWQGDGELRFEQVSVFRSVAEGLNAEVIENAGSSILAKFDEAGIPDAGYLVAYGAEATANLISENGRADAAMTLAGGDFFLLYGYRFLTGAGFSPDDLMQDRVVLDELAAWQLFSSVDCVGLPVGINGRTFYVAGVVEPEENKYTEACYGEKPRVYVSYSGWFDIPGEEQSEGAPITFCEAVLPEPVDDFAASTFALGIGVDEDEVRSNTERYTLEALWYNLKELHMQGILSNAVVYPYWESAARLAANEQSLLLIPMLIFLLLPLGWAIYGLIRLWKLVKAGGRGTLQLADHVREQHRTRRYVKQMAQRRRQRERKVDYEDMEAYAVPAAGDADDDDSAGGVQ